MLDSMSHKAYTICDINRAENIMQSIVTKINKIIHGQGRGFVFTKSHFLDLGSRTAIAKALERLADSGAIRRLSRGLYDYPEKHPALGDLLVNYERIAQALAGRDNLKIQPSGAYAANLLGLTEQVPAKIVFLTDGSHRKIQIGQSYIDDKVIGILKRRLTAKDKQMLIADIRYAPAWVEKVARRVQE